MNKNLKNCLFLAFACFFLNFVLIFAAEADILTVGIYNTESGNDTEIIKVKSDLEKIAGPEIWGLVEVPLKGAIELYSKALFPKAKEKNYIFSTTETDSEGLAIAYNPEKLKLLETSQLQGINQRENFLVAHFQSRTNQAEFLFIVSHFQSKDIRLKNQEANNWNQWLKKQSLPVILVGTYDADNQDFLEASEEIKNFEHLQQKTLWQWIKPNCFEKGNCPPTGTQCEGKYNLIEDFILVAGEAQNWNAESEILFADDPLYCQWDHQGYSDHFPVIVTMKIIPSQKEL